MAGQAGRDRFIIYAAAAIKQSSNLGWVRATGNYLWSDAAGVTVLGQKRRCNSITSRLVLFVSLGHRGPFRISGEQIGNDRRRENSQKSRSVDWPRENMLEIWDERKRNLSSSICVRKISLEAAQAVLIESLV